MKLSKHLPMALAISVFAMFTHLGAQTANDTSHLVLPGQLFIRGVDNLANNGTVMVVNLSASVDLKKGTKFTLTDSEYIDTNGGNAWKHTAGGVSGISVQYTGQNPIARGSSICIVIPYSLSGTIQVIQSFEINGQISNDFQQSVVGSPDTTSGIVPPIALNKSGFDHLYVVQSGWHQLNGQYQMPGSVIDGFVAVPVGTDERNVVTPPSLDGRDIIHQVPFSFYAFVICDNLLYFCDLIELLNGTWTLSPGTSANDLDFQGICDAVCNFSDCDGAVEIQEIPLDGVCDYSICFGGLSGDGGTIITDIIVDGISLDGVAGFDFPYCWISEFDQGQWICDYTGENGCPANLPCAIELMDDLEAWLILNGYIYGDIYIEWDRGLWCITIEQTDADFEIAFFDYDAYELQLDSIIYNPDGTTQEYVYDTVFLGELALNYNITESNCTYDLYKIVAVLHDCVNAEFDWGGLHEDYIVISAGTGYSVTVTCSNGCTYENAGYIEVPPVNGSEEEEVVERSVLFNSDLSLNVFPNPARDRVYFEISSDLGGDHRLLVAGLNGASIYSEVIQSIDGKITRVLDIRSMPAGLYIVKVEAGEKYASEKFTIIK